MSARRLVADHVGKVDLAQPAVPDRLRLRRRSILADALIIATGARRAGSACPSEQKFRGYGVSACATCDGFFYRGKEVLVVGGGNTAVEEALYPDQFRRKVTVVHRRDALRAEQILQDRLFKHPEDRSASGTRAVDEVCGTDDPLRRHPCAAEQRQDRRDHRTAGRRRFHRHRPSAGDRAVRRPDRDEAAGYIKTAPHSTATSVPGVFAAGDVADDVYRQAVTAAGLGCMAALEAERFPARAARAKPIARIAAE